MENTITKLDCALFSHVTSEISKMASLLEWVPDSLYNSAISSVVTHYSRFRRELKTLPENVQFDVYYKVCICQWYAWSKFVEWAAFECFDFQAWVSDHFVLTVNTCLIFCTIIYSSGCVYCGPVCNNRILIEFEPSLSLTLHHD